ncbi:MAG: pilus assembly protein PilM [Phycisphaerales bacterium]|nr:pilus assembly protein PilM [Phycisphaerales bacterium]
MLQVMEGDEPAVIAAAQLEIPESVRDTPADYDAVIAKELPRLLKQGGFRGRRIICSIPSRHVHTQHLQLVTVDGMSITELAASQFQIDFGVPPGSVVVRAIEVAETLKGGQSRAETICFAIGHRTVMRFIDLLRKAKLETVGVHTEAMAIVRAFDHIHRRADDDQVTTLYVDIGYQGTNVAISHGRQIVFSRYIESGGRHLDQAIADALHCDLEAAHHQRMAHDLFGRGESRPAPTAGEGIEGNAILRAAMARSAADGSASPSSRGSSSMTATEPERRQGERPAVLPADIAPTAAAKTGPADIDFSEPLDALADELSMCLRYHRALFPARTVDRMICLGGESRQIGICQYLARSLRLGAQLGDPLARLKSDGVKTPGLDLAVPQPGWAVACGLCHSPTDL